MSRGAMFALVGTVIVVAVVAAIFGWRLSQGSTATSTDTDQVCTMEAKACPDGSYVGRTGPTCEFAACPNPGAVGDTAMLNQPIVVNGIILTPLAVVEDSRCPSDVQCIQAGTVRVRTRVGDDVNAPTYVFTLSAPQVVNGETITLTEVSPGKISTQSIHESDYRFGFSVAL